MEQAGGAGELLNALGLWKEAVGGTALTYSYSYLELVCCSTSSSNCCFLTSIQISQEAGQVLWARPPPAVAERALRAIRYPMIPAAQLFQLQARSAALARHGPAVADLLLQAYQFHATSPLHYAKFFDVNGAPSCPTTTSRLPAAPRGSSTTRPATIAAPASRRSWAQAAMTRAAGSPGTCSSRHAGCR